MQIGPHQIEPALALAPMAGVTDRAFRVLCKRLGAGLAASEMTIDDPRFWSTAKSRTRMDHSGEPGLIAVQIAGADPQRLAEAARHNVAQGAQIIDINMGCPAKKVCNAESGSALMRDEALVERICRAVVEAVPVPVTLKIRTGWAREHRNGITVARIAEGCGIAALAVHGRTREDLYGGAAEYDTIAAIKQAVSIPLWANGDIDTPQKALAVLRHTGADGLMIGRAAQGRPWIFREIGHYLASGRELPPPSPAEVGALLLEHLDALYQLYGEAAGARIARKHIQWYCRSHDGSEAFWASVNRVDSAALQRQLVGGFFGIEAALAQAA
jgi:tRNA-dihydrouridine synthase B